MLVPHPLTEKGTQTLEDTASPFLSTELRQLQEVIGHVTLVRAKAVVVN